MDIFVTLLKTVEYISGDKSSRPYLCSKPDDHCQIWAKSRSGTFSPCFTFTTVFNKLQFFIKSSNLLISPQIIIHQIYLNLHVRCDVHRDLTEDIELRSARSCLRLGSKLGRTDPDQQVGIPGFQEKVLARGVEDNVFYFDPNRRRIYLVKK